MIRGAMAGHAAAPNGNAWCAKQAYIALGFGLAACAEQRIASCPMEGFDAAAVAKEVGVPDTHVVAALLVVGRAHADDKVANPYPQFRFPEADVIVKQ
jgi:nitroreductase/dihydropteridine reductase